jgi:hypothetical protein
MHSPEPTISPFPLTCKPDAAEALRWQRGEVDIRFGEACDSLVGTRRCECWRTTCAEKCTTAYSISTTDAQAPRKGGRGTSSPNSATSPMGAQLIRKVPYGEALTAPSLSRHRSVVSIGTTLTPPLLFTFSPSWGALNWRRLLHVTGGSSHETSFRREFPFVALSICGATVATPRRGNRSNGESCA